MEADEESDPEKYIEQLSGKLGETIRQYTEDKGEPDFELEKFAINSVISATHTAEMDDKDRDDIIKKINTSGSDDTEGPSKDDDMGDFDDSDLGNDNNNGAEDNFGDDNEFGDEGGEEDIEELHYLEEKLTNLFIEPKKNNMFQPGSNDILKTNEGVIDKRFLLNKLNESFQQEEIPVVRRPRREMPFRGLKKEDIEKARGGGSYQVYHDTFDGVVKAVSEFLKDKGIESNKVTADLNEPMEGETNRYNAILSQDGTPEEELCTFEVHNMGDKYELTIDFKK